MENWDTKVERIMAIEDPREACIAIATDKELTLDIVEKLLEMYMERHNVDADEMGYYPDGERVLTPDMFQ